MDTIMKFIIKNLDKSFLVFLLSQAKYETDYYFVLDMLSKTHNKICMVLTNDLYHNLTARMKKAQIDINNFFFIDLLSGHYKKPIPVKNCVFLSKYEIKEILEAIDNAVKKDNSNLLIFDNFAQLLFHFPSYKICKFANTLKVKDEYSNVKKIFIMQKDNDLLTEDNKRLTNDLELFADKIIELNS